MRSGHWSTRPASVMTTAVSALRPGPQPNRVALASSPLWSRDQIVTYIETRTFLFVLYSQPSHYAQRPLDRGLLLCAATRVIPAIASLDAAARPLERVVRHAASTHVFSSESKRSLRSVPAPMLSLSAAELCCPLQALSVARATPKHQIFPDNCLQWIQMLPKPHFSLYDNGY
jgi:hypothetical protein